MDNNIRIAYDGAAGKKTAFFALAVALSLLSFLIFNSSASSATPTAYAQSAVSNLTQMSQTIPVCGATCGTAGICKAPGTRCELVDSCYRCVVTTSISTTTTSSISSTSTSTTSIPTTTALTGGQDCLVGAPNGYCGYSTCPSGQTCVSGTSPAHVIKSGNVCTISNGGYATGTCQASQGTSPGIGPSPTSPGACGYLPSNLATILYTSESWYCPINNYTAGIWSKYLPLALVALLFAFMVAALLIMIGISSKNDRLRNYGMGELMEATASAVIVILFIYISAVMFGLFPGSLVGPINPYSTSLHLINSTISATQGIYGNLYDTYSVAAFYTSLNVSVSAGFSGGGTLLHIGTTVVKSNYAGLLQLLLLEPTQVLISMLTDAVALLYAEYFLIIFFAVASIPAFLVPGVIFRAIIPTRALGGILIAMAMGFYIIMPTLFALAYYFTAPQLGQQLNTLSVQLNQFGSGTGSQTNALTPTSPLVTTLASVQSAMGDYWLLILFYPALIIALTYAFIMQAANFIGGASYTGSKIRGFI